VLEIDVMPYAERTKVEASKTRVEIENLLRKAGATRIGIITEPTAAVVIFEAHDRRLKFTIRLDERVDAKGAQARRSQWRALMLCIKAKLESVASKIETFEEAFLAHVVVGDGQTVYEHVRPKLIGIAKTGHMVPLLPAH
jgi:hypothetical protein